MARFSRKSFDVQLSTADSMRLSPSQNARGSRIRLSPSGHPISFMTEQASIGSRAYLDLLESHEDLAERQTPWTSTAMALVTIMVGAGVLGHPKICARIGAPMFVALLVFACVVSAHCCCLLCTAIATAQQAHPDVPITKMDDVGEVAFARIGKFAPKVIVNGMLVGKVACYMVLIGQNIEFCLPFLKYRPWVLILTVVLLPAAFIRNVSMLNKLSMVGVLCSIIYFVTILGGAIHAGQEREWPKVTVSPGIGDIISQLPLIMFAYGPLDVLATQRSQMAEKDKLPRAIIISHATVLVVYICAGVVGFLGFGPGVDSNVSLSMYSKVGVETHKWAWGYTLASAVVINLGVICPIALYCLFTIIESSYSAEHPMGKVPNTAMRVGTVTICCAVSLFCPFFLEVLGILSSILVVPLVLVLPVVYSWKVARDSGNPHGPIMTSIDIVLLLLALVAFGGGLSGALTSLAKNIEAHPEAANPFANFF